MIDKNLEASTGSGSVRRYVQPSFYELGRRGVVMVALILGCMLFVSMIARPTVIADPRSSGIATAGLLIAAIFSGWAYAAEKDHSAIQAFAVGMPLGFFFFQNSYARSASMNDLAAGSSRVMAIAAVIAIVSALAAWAWRKFSGKYS